MNKIFIYTDVLQQLLLVTCFILCSNHDFLNSYTIFISLSFFILTLLHGYDDTAFASTSAAYLAASKAGIMPLNYRSCIWEIRCKPRYYSPCIRNLSNLHRPCADSLYPPSESFSEAGRKEKRISKI